ncbi:hypothetical protein HNQ37_000491 [Lactovum miscens]|uniref:Uncharacterized protein n=1 Tax=Lactovum miscens TaxID=190387 RepID=A0A841C897_9LACT|nr:hypothetical protein [Lactovum miscens]
MNRMTKKINNYFDKCQLPLSVIVLVGGLYAYLAFAMVVTILDMFHIYIFSAFFNY